jgi:hypothetical protein
MTAAHARAALEVTGSRHDQPHAAEGDQAAAARAALGTALGRHLDREEHEVLPLPGRRVTAAEPEPVAKYFIRALGPRRLLARIPWLSSPAGARERKQVLPAQPAAFRVIEALTRTWYARRRLRLGLPEALPAPAVHPGPPADGPAGDRASAEPGSQARPGAAAPQGPGSHPYTGPGD